MISAPKFIGTYRVTSRRPDKLSFAIPLLPWYGSHYDGATDTSEIRWGWWTIFLHLENFWRFKLKAGRLGGSVSWGWQ